MPIYEFKCRTCESQFEVLTSFKERDKVKCPACQSQEVDALLTTFSTKITPYQDGSSGPGVCQGCCNHQCGNLPR